jgi:hypothetical protein
VAEAKTHKTVLLAQVAEGKEQVAVVQQVALRVQAYLVVVLLQALQAVAVEARLLMVLLVVAQRVVLVELGLHF